MTGPDPSPRLRPALLGPLGPPQLACLRRWGREGLDLGALFIHLTDHPLPPPRRLGIAGYLPMTRATWGSEEGLDQVTTFLSTHGATGLTCLAEGDARRLHTAAHRLPPSVGLWLPSTAALDRVASKLDQMALAEACGFSLLPSWSSLIESGPEGRLAWPPLPEAAFPAVVRPSDPRGVRPPFKVRWLPNRQALNDFGRTLAMVAAPLILQPLVHGPNLLVHGARAQSGAWVHWQAFLVARKFEGLALTVTPTPLDPGLATACQCFVEQAGVVGVFHFDLLVDPATGRPHFLELNPRLGGTTAKVLAAGHDEPGWLLAAYGAMPRPEVPLDQRAPVTVTNRLALVKCLRSLGQGTLTDLDYPRISTRRRAWDLLRGFLLWRDEVLDWRHHPASTLWYVQDLLRAHWFR